MAKVERVEDEEEEGVVLGASRRGRMGRRSSKGRGWGGGAISAARDWGSLLGEQKLHLQMNSRDKSHNFSGLSRSYRGFCQPQPSFSFLT